MSSKYLVDTHSWIEYILGTHSGSSVRKIVLDKGNQIFTLESTFAEIKEWCLRENYSFDLLFPKIRQDSFEVPLFLDNWLRAAEIKFEKRKTIKDFGLIDALLLAYQEESGAIIVTGDPHFKGMKNTKYLGR